MLRIGKGATRASIRRALKRGGPFTVSYKNILEPDHIREALAGVHDAGDPDSALPLLAWLASHPNTPGDVLVDLSGSRRPEVLVSLAMNRNLPKPLEKALRRHRNPEVREQVLHILSKRRG
jgi:hypothetical protein